MDANFLKANMLNDEAQAAAMADSTEAITGGATPTAEALAPANTMADPAPANQDGAFDFRAWPEEWRDGAGNVREKFVAHVRSQEAYWDALGVPCHRAALNGSNRLLPHRFVSPQNHRADINVNLEYVTLTREVPAGQPENPTYGHKSSRFFRMVANSRQAVGMIVVPREEVTTLEAQGWKV